MDTPKNEERYKQLLLSEKWDVPNAPPPRLRYVVFSQPRTGSELLCARLRLQGLGIPLEYFNTDVIAARLRCLDDRGNVDVMKYLSRLEAVRTTANGVFGTKLQPRHLLNLSADDPGFGEKLLRRFDKVVLLRRRDVLLQAISMARSHLTGQWHVLPGDEIRKIATDDERLFAAIDRVLGWLRSGEQVMRRVAKIFEEPKSRSLYYEDLTMLGTIDSTADWIAQGLGRQSVPPESTPDFELPRKGDAGEAEAIKQRYLVHSGPLSWPEPA